MKTKNSYLGSIIEGNKIFLDANKVEIIKEFKFPKTSKALRRFLAMCDFFSRFVKHYAKIAQRLTSLQNSHQKTFIKSVNENEAALVDDFNILKQPICDITSNNLPNYDKMFYLC